MLAGAVVPQQLLQQLIKKSLLHSPPPPPSSYFLHYPLHHFSSYYRPSWYWGREAMDPEPGRCRRTDGKKWRCSRDVVPGHKYCERHVHRGRNRSRKPVEIPTTTTGTSGGSCDGGGLFKSSTKMVGALPVNAIDHRSDGSETLRHFLSIQEPEGAGLANTSTCLSISMPGSSSSDVSLKLSTGNGEEASGGNSGRELLQSQLNWGSEWSTNQVASIGGPLAEMLRSSTTNSSL